MGAETYFNSTKLEFFFRSKASRMASPTPKLLREKSALVWSGTKPHSVASCVWAIATSTMSFAPCSLSLFPSRLQATMDHNQSGRDSVAVAFQTVKGK